MTWLLQDLKVPEPFFGFGSLSAKLMNQGARVCHIPSLEPKRAAAPRGQVVGLAAESFHVHDHVFGF